MAFIANYPTITNLSSSTLFPVYDPNNGDTRKLSYGALSTALTTDVTASVMADFEAYVAQLISGYITQYSQPSASSFTVNITDEQASIHLILTPTTGFADGTIVLPSATNTLDGQKVLVNCTQAVTSLAINLNGATAARGAPTTLAANAFFTLKFDRVTLTWYRIG